jgi:hypothetical protein
MKRTLLTVAIVAALAMGICGAALAGSGAGAINLSFPIGARYNAMGEAGTALAQDVTAQWWNPGGLGFLSQRPEPHDLHIMQSSLAEGLADDIGLYWAGYAAPMGSSGTLGFSLNFLDMGEQQGTDENGNLTREFNSYMFAFGASYGALLTPDLGVGLGVKYFRDKLADDSAMQDTEGSGSGDSFGVDLGVLWKVPSLKTNFAVAIANLGPNVTHVDAEQSDPLPRKLTLGLAHSLYHSEFMSVLLVGDYLVPLYKWKDSVSTAGSTGGYTTAIEPSQAEHGFGAEWSYLHSLFVRVGFKSAAYGDIKDSTFGFGVDLATWANQPITFDFATVPQARGLPNVSRMSLAYRF